MLSRLSIVFKLIALIFLSTHVVFAIDEEPWSSEIITKDFDGQIDDKIETYHYNHESVGALPCWYAPPKELRYAYVMVPIYSQRSCICGIKMPT